MKAVSTGGQRVAGLYFFSVFDPQNEHFLLILMSDQSGKQSCFYNVLIMGRLAFDFDIPFSVVFAYFRSASGKVRNVMNIRFLLLVEHFFKPVLFIPFFLFSGRIWEIDLNQHYRIDLGQ